MATLPFLQPPAEPRKRKCGNDESGIIEVPLFGGITVGEAATVSDLTTAEDSSLVMAAKAADAIAKTEGITISEAFDVIEKAVNRTPLEQGGEDIRLRHLGVIESVGSSYLRSGRTQTLALITSILRHRLRLPDWGMADTAGLHKAILDDLIQLVDDERAAELLPAGTNPDDETLGKPPVESGSPSKRTGTKSAGS